MFEEGCAPSCIERISASSPVKFGLQGVRAARSHGFQGAMLSRNPATHGQIPTDCGRCDSSCFCRDGTRNGLFRSEQGTGSQRKEERKRLSEGCKGQQRGQFSTIRPVSKSPFHRLRRGALATGWILSPLGERQRGGLSFCPALLSLSRQAKGHRVGKSYRCGERAGRGNGRFPENTPRTRRSLCRKTLQVRRASNERNWLISNETQPGRDKVCVGKLYKGEEPEPELVR